MSELIAAPEAPRFPCPDCGRLVSVEGERCVRRPQPESTREQAPFSESCQGLVKK